MPDTAHQDAVDMCPVAVRVRDLSVIRREAKLLDSVSCTLPAGRCTAIFGPNGCGKTTFTRVLTGQMFFAHGHVEVLGQKLGSTDIRALRRRVAVVNPTTDSADAHVSGAVVDAQLAALDAVLTGCFGTIGLYDTPTDSQRAAATHLLSEVGLAGHEAQRFATLSTGEQRRALIARALVSEPELLILDEPTAGLDVRGREQLLNTIEAILSSSSPPTVLMITHHVEELSPRTAQVLLMKRGRFVAAGPPRQVITPEALSDVFDCPVFVRRLHGRYWLEVLPEAGLLRGREGRG